MITLGDRRLQMVCDFFKASSECEQCLDCCDLQRIIGDKEECLHEIQY